MSDHPWLVRIYLSSVVLSAAVIIGWLAIMQGITASGNLVVAGLFTTCMVLIWMFPLPIGFKTHLYLDTALVIATVLTFEPTMAMLITGAGTLIAQVARRRFWEESLFNTAQTVIQTAIAALIVYLGGLQPGSIEASDPGYIATVLIIGVVLFLTSSIVVGTIVAVQSGLSPFGVWVDSILRSEDSVYAGHFAEIGLGIIVATLASGHPWTVLLLIPPGAVIYIALQQGLESRRQASLAFRLQEKNLTEAQRMAHIGSWEWNLSSGAQGWSDEAYRILGYNEKFSAPTLEHLLERVHPDERGGVSNRIHDAVRLQSSFDFEHRILLENGAERFVRHRGEVTGDDVEGRQLVAIIHDISEQTTLKAQLEHMAYHDQLTGLMNRSRLVEELEHSLEAWSRGGSSFALLFVDLDGFKQVNDTFGHNAGDKILADVGQRLENAVRQHDCVARYGGDEFIILARSVTRESEARRLATRLLNRINETIAAADSDATVDITASIGIVIPSSWLEKPDDLLLRVDKALYEAKRRGKNRFTFYSDEIQKDSLSVAS